MTDDVSDKQSMLLQLNLVSVDLNGQRKPAAVARSKPDPGPARMHGAPPSIQPHGCNKLITTKQCVVERPIQLGSLFTGGIS